MDLNGLSADQAPPISAPFRFFLTAPLFAILAGFLILFSDASVLSSRFSIETIAITHAMAIGFFGFIMLGALSQMLPVLAGVKVKNIGFIAKYSHISLILGTLFMVFGLLNNSSISTLLATLFLALGFLTMILSMLNELRNVVHVTASIRAIILSLVFALIVVLMGLYLLYSHGIQEYSSTNLIIANIHSVWAIFGFAGILIIGVTFHILPMFYVAPRFKQFCKQKVIWYISTGLLLWVFFNMFLEEFSLIAKIWIATFFWAFATTVWKKLNNRRRPITDVTIWYWRIASIFLTLGAFSWVFNDFFNEEYIVVVSIFIGGFILSIMSGMLYKIIPFLVWFHLNSTGYMSIPTITEMINKKSAQAQFVLFVFSMFGFALSFFLPELLPIFATTFILSMAILEYNIIAPVLIYAKIIKTKPDFDMSAFSIPTGD